MRGMASAPRCDARSGGVLRMSQNGKKMSQNGKGENHHDALQRDVLPIPNEAYAGPILYDANDPAAVFPPIQEIRPPQGAPNVLVVLIDDVGFGAPVGPDLRVEGNPFNGTVKG